MVCVIFFILFPCFKGGGGGGSFLFSWGGGCYCLFYFAFVSFRFVFQCLVDACSMIFFSHKMELYPHEKNVGFIFTDRAVKIMQGII